jgi:DNA-binding CsgD family transcriptional regulator
MMAVGHARLASVAVAAWWRLSDPSGGQELALCAAGSQLSEVMLETRLSRADHFAQPAAFWVLVSFVASRLVAASRSGLIGRGRVLSRVLAHLAEVAAGRGHLVLFSGEPGIGKTRLASAVTEVAVGLGFNTAWGSCRETEGAPPYWPWAQIFRATQASNQVRDAVLAPLLNPVQVDIGETDRFRLFDAATQALMNAAANRPLLIVLDDIHRADEASLMLLRFIFPAVRNTPLMVLGSYRDTDITPIHPVTRVIGEIAGDASFDLIELAGFTRTETAEFICQAAGTAEAVKVTALYERTDGNPFFLTELLRLGPALGDGVPSTVEAAIGARLRRLPESTQELLMLAAVLGRDTDGRLLAEIAERDIQDVVGALTPALKHRLITTHPHAPGDYRFGHVLVQQAVYATLSAERRLNLHDRVATVLERSVREDPDHADTLAYHAAQAVNTAGGRQRAFVTACRAARHAADRLADETAAAWYTRALALAPPNDDQRFALLVDLGRVAGRVGKAEQAQSAYEQAWTMALRSGQPRQAGIAALGLGQVVVSSGTIDAGLVDMLDTTLGRLEPTEDELRVRLTARLATELYWGQLPRSRQLGSRAVTAARGVNDQPTLAAALAAQQFVLRGPDHLQERLELGEELLQLARKLGDDQLELHTRRILFSDQLRIDLTAADSQLEALDELARRARRPIARWYTLVFRAVRATMVGRSREAETLVDQAEELGNRIGAQPASMYATAQRFILYRNLGRVGEREDSLRRQIALHPTMIALRTKLSLLLAETGRYAESTALLDELAADHCAALPRDLLWLASVTALAETATTLDHAEHAASLHEVLAPYRGQVAEFGVAGWCGAVDRVLALTATTLRRWDDAEAAFHSALRTHEAWGAVPLIKATLHGYATMLRRRAAVGDRERATRLIGEAAHLQRSATLRRTAARAGQLTAREIDVLNLIAQGASNKEIARRLALSVHTVERHIANVYAKIGVRNRAEATAYQLCTKHRP